MSLLSDFESFDRLACQRAKFELASTKYINRIKNEAKRKYAEHIAASYVGMELPDVELGEMARQAVRMALDGIWENCKP